MNQSKIEGPFLVIELEKMASDLYDLGTEFLGFGIWAFEDEVLRNLIEFRPEKYMADFKHKRITETSSEWYDTFCRGIIDEDDVLEFFKRFQIDYRTPIRLGVLPQFRIVTGTDEQGYGYFRVLGPEWLDN